MIDKQRQSSTSPQMDKYQGVLLCPQCNHDYPDLANYKMVPDQNDPLAQNKGPNRFVKFQCVKCGTMLKKTLPLWLTYLSGLAIIPGCIIFAYILSYYAGNAPLGFGVNQFYAGQYLDSYGMVISLVLPPLILVLLAILLERPYQRLEKYDQKFIRTQIMHSVFGVGIIAIFISAYFLVISLNLIKDFVASSSKPEYQKRIEYILKYTPLWKGPFYVMHGQGYLLNADFDAAIKNFDLGIETIQDHSYPYFYRGIAHLYSKNYDQAEVDLNTAIKINTGKWEPDDMYKRLWVYLARERKNGSGQEYLETLQNDLKPGQWPDSLLLLFLGKTDPQELQKTFGKKDKIKKCKIFFYSAVYLKMKGHDKKARIEFERAKETHASGCFELHAAGFELADLTNNKTTMDSSNNGGL